MSYTQHVCHICHSSWFQFSQYCSLPLTVPLFVVACRGCFRCVGVWISCFSSLFTPAIKIRLRQHSSTRLWIGHSWSTTHLPPLPLRLASQGIPLLASFCVRQTPKRITIQHILEVVIQRGSSKLNPSLICDNTCFYCLSEFINKRWLCLFVCKNKVLCKKLDQRLIFLMFCFQAARLSRNLLMWSRATIVQAHSLNHFTPTYEIIKHKGT